MDRRTETVIFLLVACGIGLSVAAHVFAMFPFDLRVSHELQEIRSPVFSTAMRSVSALGTPLYGAFLIGSITLVFLVRRMWIEAAFVLATTSSVFLAAVLKVLVGRPRPPLYSLNPADLFLAVDRYSFPSGHVLFFVVFFGFVGYLGWSRLSGWLRSCVVGICGVLIMLIAPSRIYLGAHWASDVIGSYIIGMLLLFILVVLYRHAVQRYREGPR